VQVALTNFVDSVDRIRDVAAQIDIEVAHTSINSSVRRRHETLSWGSVVILSGFFEVFLREVVKAFVRDVCSLSRPFASLPPDLQKTHFTQGAQVLLNVARGRQRWFGTTTQQLALRLSSVLQQVPYDLVWEAFADTKSNPTAETVEGILKGCAVARPWQAVATHAPRGRSAPVLKLELDSFIAVRNECAHTGRPSLTPSTSDLRGYADTVVDIGNGVLGSLRQRVATV
jgi:hypothetical protein